MTRQAGRRFRAIPSVDAVMRREELGPLISRHGQALVAGAVREAADRLRRAAAGDESALLEGGPEAVLAQMQLLVEEALRRRADSSLLRVINASGIVIHTNLGRAVLSPRARQRAAMAAGGCTSLEYDLATGRRGSRSSHLERCFDVLFPGRAALAVNNNASALFLALSTLAGGREVILSRGELVEIGGSFRVPDVMAASGARLREVGTTNRTRRGDYEAAIGPQTALLLKVHPSNFRIVGFTQEASVPELAELAGRHELPLLVDQGSGCLLDLSAAGIQDEPTVSALLDDGADLVTFSGDKLLGGPQAGLVVGRPDLVDRMKSSPLYRVLRLDKIAIAALEATLDAYLRGSAREELPVLRMLLAGREELEARARRIAAALQAGVEAPARVRVIEGVSRVGGGAAPMQELPTWLVAIQAAEAEGDPVPSWEDALRAGEPPVIGRIHDGALLLDPRTIDPADEAELVTAVAAAVSGRRPVRSPNGCA